MGRGGKDYERRKKRRESGGMQTQGPYRVEEVAAEEEESSKRGASANYRAAEKKRDLNLFKQSPGLISPTNRATGKLCRIERGQIE